MKIDLFLKDFKLMLEEGLRLGVPLPLTSLAQQLTTATATAGRGNEDLAAIVTTFELLAGLETSRPSEKKN
jgi:3-hydroxyisobutyrate dehydrogenase-like beta-hydroxyacid dehydrogenase